MLESGTMGFMIYVFMNYKYVKRETQGHSL